MTQDPAIISAYRFHIDIDYFIMVNALLMYMSKGGMNYNNLKYLGIDLKEKYLDTFKEIYKKINESKNETDDNGVQIE